MIGIHDQDEVYRLGKVRSFGIGQHGHEHAQTFAMRARSEVAQHVRFDVDREQLSFRYALGNPYAEISGAGTQIGNAAGALKMQRIQYGIGFLPGITGRVVEFFCPNFGVIERVLIAPVIIHIMTASGTMRYGRIGRSLREQLTCSCSSR